MRLLVCLHYKFIPVDKSDSHLWIFMSQCFPRLMIFFFYHSNIFNPPPPIYSSSFYFIWLLTTQTCTHTHTKMWMLTWIPLATCSRCLQSITISLSLLPLTFHVLLPLPGANQRQPRALWTLKGPQRRVADRQHRELQDWGHARRQSKEQWTWYVRPCRCPYVSHI